LDERSDPAIRIVEHDPGWAAQAQQELHRLAEAAKGAQQDRLAYIEAKQGYVRDLEARAGKWARATRVS
jgi:GrpB-like predicted nucleotidyltransferase (UPF0157 family)